jgi:hypothetical protein
MEYNLNELSHTTMMNDGSDSPVAALAAMPVSTLTRTIHQRRLFATSVNGCLAPPHDPLQYYPNDYFTQGIQSIMFDLNCQSHYSCWVVTDSAFRGLFVCSSIIDERVNGALVLHFLFMFYLFLVINIVVSQRLVPAIRYVSHNLQTKSLKVSERYYKYVGIRGI